MKVFWRIKDHGPYIRFHEGKLHERCQGLVKLSERRFSEAFWYREDEVDIVETTDGKEVTV
jgi:hypothetical protein